MLRMNPRWVMFMLSWLLNAVPVAVSAKALDPAQVCGPPDETLDQHIKADLQGTAQTLAKIGSAQLQGNVDIQRQRIIVGKDRSDALRELHYLNSISCNLIISDQTVSTDDKLARISVLRKGLTLPSTTAKSPQ
jgi:hypothetical protein